MNKTLLQVLVAVPCLLAEAALPCSFNYGGTRYADLPETGKVVSEKDGRRVSELTWTAPDGKLRRPRDFRLLFYRRVPVK